MPSREKNINSLCVAVQHNFRHRLLLPSREENINSLGAAIGEDGVNWPLFLENDITQN